MSRAPEGSVELRWVRLTDPAAQPLVHGRRLLLETGPAQPEAIRLYASAGFELIPGYGRYRDEPDCLSYAKYLDGRQVGV
jgi:hypothetical protein